MSKLETVAALSNSPEAQRQTEMLQELAQVRQSLPEVAQRLRELQSLTDRLADMQASHYRAVEAAEKDLERHQKFVQAELQQLLQLHQKPISETVRVLDRLEKTSNSLISQMDGIEKRIETAQRLLQQSQTAQKGAMWAACLSAACLLAAVGYSVFMN